MKKMTFVVAGLLIFLLAYISTAWDDPRQCGIGLVPPSSFSCTLNPSAPDFYSNTNYQCIFGLHWSTICYDLFDGLNPDDGLDAVQEGIIDKGNAQRLPGKPRFDYDTRVPTLIKNCNLGKANGVKTQLGAIKSSVNAHIGLLNNYAKFYDLSSVLKDRWMAYAQLEKKITDTKIADPSLRCV